MPIEIHVVNPTRSDTTIILVALRVSFTAFHDAHE